MPPMSRSPRRSGQTRWSASRSGPTRPRDAGFSRVEPLTRKSDENYSRRVGPVRIRARRSCGSTRVPRDREHDGTPFVLRRDISSENRKADFSFRPAASAASIVSNSDLKWPSTIVANPSVGGLSARVAFFGSGSSIVRRGFFMIVPFRSPRRAPSVAAELPLDDNCSSDQEAKNNWHQDQRHQPLPQTEFLSGGYVNRPSCGGNSGLLDGDRESRRSLCHDVERNPKSCGLCVPFCTISTAREAKW